MVQRTATLRHLRDLTRLKVRASDRQASTEGTDHDLAWLLVVENLIFGAESEVRWLDHVESSLARAALHPRRATPPAADRDPTTDATTSTTTTSRTTTQGAPR